MFIIRKSFRFEAGHYLPYHEGKCRHPHGHSYQIDIEIRAPQLHTHGSQRGMVCDFSEISNIVSSMIATYLDHKWLNDSLQMETTTAECIAEWVFHHLSPSLPDLYAVTIHETPTCSATYQKGSGRED